MENKQNNFRFKKRIHFRYIILIIKFFFIINFFDQKVSNNDLRFLNNLKFSNITLKIKGIGTKNIFGSFFSQYPDIVYINGIKRSTITNSYDFNLTDNIVELIWNNSINNCEYLFFDCSFITEIDFSNFDTSEVTNMCGIFSGCSSLTSLNLSNFNTSLVTDMSSMFSRCSSLTSLNLSNFNTSIVTFMYHMFSGCSSLTSLNLSNFNICFMVVHHYLL